MTYPRTNYPHMASAAELVAKELERIGCDAIAYSGSLTVNTRSGLRLLNDLTDYLAVDALRHVRKGSSAASADRVLCAFSAGVDRGLRIAQEEEAEETWHKQMDEQEAWA